MAQGYQQNSRFIFILQGCLQILSRKSRILAQAANDGFIVRDAGFFRFIFSGPVLVVLEIL